MSVATAPDDTATRPGATLLKSDAEALARA
jgi:hypothetical protein